MKPAKLAATVSSRTTGRCARRLRRAEQRGRALRAARGRSPRGRAPPGAAHAEAEAGLAIALLGDRREEGVAQGRLVGAGGLREDASATAARSSTNTVVSTAATRPSASRAARSVAIASSTLRSVFQWAASGSARLSIRWARRAPPARPRTRRVGHARRLDRARGDLADAAVAEVGAVGVAGPAVDPDPHPEPALARLGEALDPLIEDPHLEPGRVLHERPHRPPRRRPRRRPRAAIVSRPRSEFDPDAVTPPSRRRSSPRSARGPGRRRWARTGPPCRRSRS